MEISLRIPLKFLQESSNDYDLEKVDIKLKKRMARTEVLSSIPGPSFSFILYQLLNPDPSTYESETIAAKP